MPKINTELLTQDERMAALADNEFLTEKNKNSPQVLLFNPVYTTNQRQAPPTFNFQTGFITLVQLLLVERVHCALSSESELFLTEFHKRLYPLVENVAVNFYAHVFFMFNCYLDATLNKDNSLEAAIFFDSFFNDSFQPPKASKFSKAAKQKFTQHYIKEKSKELLLDEGVMLDALLSALIVSAKIVFDRDEVGMNTFTMLMEELYVEEYDIISNILANHISQQKMSGTCDHFWIDNETELTYALDALQLNVASKGQIALFKKAIQQIPPTSKPTIERCADIITVINKGSYKDYDMLHLLEGYFLKTIDWNCQLWAESEVNAFALLCWRYTTTLFQNESTDSLKKMAHNFSQFHKRALRPAPLPRPARGYGQDDDNDALDDLLGDFTALTLKFDFKTLGEKRGYKKLSLKDLENDAVPDASPFKIVRKVKSY